MRLNEQDLIVYSDRLEDISRKQVGGKAWNLFHLMQQRISVPPWIVISTSVFNRLSRPLKKDVEKHIMQIDFASQTQIEQASKQIRNLIIKIEPDKKFIINLDMILDQIFNSTTLFSIRSSVVDEDSSDNSFAGQMDSFLNIDRHDMINKIKEVWASAFSSRALLYRKHRNIKLTNIAAAIIIQEMVQSYVSGILFTRDPENNAENCLISAGYGLGEGIVSNRVQTDTYIIGRESNEIISESYQKDMRLVFDSRNSKGNYYEKIPVKLNAKAVLSEQQIRQLRDIGIKIEKYFGNAQDIEWGFDDYNNLYIFQSRPIIFNKNHKKASTIRIWDNSNIVESYPGITLPLTFSFICKGYETAFCNAALSFIFLKKAIKKDLHIFKNMLGLLHGRVYYNLFNWYKMLSYLPGFKQHKQAWDQMIGINKKVVFPAQKISLIIRFFTLIKVTLKLFKVRRTAVKFFNHFNDAYNYYKNIDLEKKNEEQLIEIFELLWQEFMPHWHLTLQNDFYAMKYYDWLKRLCRYWNLAEQDNLHDQLLCGQPDIESVKPIRSILQICRLINTQRNYQDLFTIADENIIWNALKTDAEYEGLYLSVKHHICAFGDRGMEELKLEKQTFREKPEELIKLIKQYYHNELSIEDLEQREKEIRQSAENVVKHKLKSIFKRGLFWIILHKTRQAVANRENMRFARSRLYGIVRRLFHRMAQLFVEQGILDSVSDIHYLTINEVFEFVTGRAMTQNLMSLVGIRKKEYARFSRDNPAERIQSEGLPYLSAYPASECLLDQKKLLRGIGCSSGEVAGKARIIYTPDTQIQNTDYILVTKSTDPGWVFLMLSSKGIVVERGSVLSHTAIIGRELGIPTIVGAKSATCLIPDHSPITINGSTGVVTWQ
jgi:phosphohistidine swiveling domain-containing protein